jgi:hypothetical protein
MDKNLLAQVGKPLGPVITGIGNIGFEGGDPGSAPTLTTKLLSGTVGILTVIGGIFFLVQIFLGALSIISSNGEPQKLEGARKKIITGIIGIIVLTAAIFLAQLVGYILGIEILNPVSYIEDLSL